MKRTGGPQGALCDVLKFPFALLPEARQAVHRQQRLRNQEAHATAHGLNSHSSQSASTDCVVIKRHGDVSESMDMSIGRPVVKIKGKVSVNNYLEIDGLWLTGRYMYLQLRLDGGEKDSVPIPPTCSPSSSPPILPPPLPTIATFHLIVVTTTNTTLRVTLSSLYDAPQFLGASLRLPLPSQLLSNGWYTLCLDLDSLLQSYCSYSSPHIHSTNTLNMGDDGMENRGKGAMPTLKAVKSIQLCSSMILRDIVTSDKPLQEQAPPKELTIKPAEGVTMQWFYLHLYLFHSQIHVQSSMQSLVDVTNQLITKGKRGGKVGGKLGEKEKSDESGGSEKCKPTLQTLDTFMSTPSYLPPASNASLSAMKIQVQSDSPTLSRRPLTSSGQAVPSPRRLTSVSSFPTASPYAPSSSPSSITTYMDREKAEGESMGGRQDSINDAPQSNYSTANVETPSASAAASTPGLSGWMDAPDSGANTGAGTVLFPPRGHGTHSSTTLSPSHTIVRLSIPVTPPSARVLSLEKQLSYSGGPIALINKGCIAIVPAGPLLVINEIGREEMKTGEDEEEGDNEATFSGFARLFKSLPCPSASVDSPLQSGAKQCRQAFIRAHSNPISLLELSPTQSILVSCEGCTNGLMILWNVEEGKKLVQFRPHSEGSCIAACISHDESLIVTVGLDSCKRVQIIAWDLPSILAHSDILNVGREGGKEGGKIGTNKTSHNVKNLAAKGSRGGKEGGREGGKDAISNHLGGFVVARQISDFPVNRIAFSPFVPGSLISCGRENVRMWRMRKGHLPGRPIPLNDLSRGSTFTDIGFMTESWKDEGRDGRWEKGKKGESDGGLDGGREGSRKVALVSSSRGSILKIDCVNECVLCVYQLHSGPLNSLIVRSGFAVTGGDDCRVRAWPLDFSDFLLEAHHESPVSKIHSSVDGRRLLIGTSTGTLGLLNVSTHSYSTLLRSHTSECICACVRPSMSVSTHAEAEENISPESGEKDGSEEFVTLGKDGTIRLWDGTTGQQRVEFNSPSDLPTCATYHPVSHTLICGFASGFVRVFDVASTSTLVERRVHASPVSSLVFNSISPPSHKLILLVGGTDGSLCACDPANSYHVLTTLLPPLSHSVTSSSTLSTSNSSSSTSSPTHFPTNAVSSQLKIAVSPNGDYLICCYDSLSSVYVFNLTSLTCVYKGSPAFTHSHSFKHTHESHGNGHSQSTSVTGSPPLHISSQAASSSTSHSSTLSSFNAALTSLAHSHTHHHATVSGVTFASPTRVLISTHTHLISIPFDIHENKEGGREGGKDLNKRNSLFDDSKCVKRVDFGYIHSLLFDPHTNLVYLGVRSPSSSSSSVNSSPDSVVILYLTHPATSSATTTTTNSTTSTVVPHSSSLFFSPPQHYPLPSLASLTGILALPKQGRLVTTDTVGSISIWQLNHEILSQLKESHHETLSLLSTPHSKEARSEGTHGGGKEGGESSSGAISTPHIDRLHAHASSSETSTTPASQSRVSSQKPTPKTIPQSSSQHRTPTSISRLKAKASTSNSKALNEKNAEKIELTSGESQSTTSPQIQVPENLHPEAGETNLQTSANEISSKSIISPSRKATKDEQGKLEGKEKGKEKSGKGSEGSNNKEKKGDPTSKSKKVSLKAKFDEAVDETGQAEEKVDVLASTSSLPPPVTSVTISTTPPPQPAPLPPIFSIPCDGPTPSETIGHLTTVNIPNLLPPSMSEGGKEWKEGGKEGGRYILCSDGSSLILKNLAGNSDTLLHIPHTNQISSCKILHCSLSPQGRHVVSIISPTTISTSFPPSLQPQPQPKMEVCVWSKEGEIWKFSGKCPLLQDNEIVSVDVCWIQDNVIGSQGNSELRENAVLLATCTQQSHSYVTSAIPSLLSFYFLPDETLANGTFPDFLALTLSLPIPQSPPTPSLAHYRVLAIPHSKLAHTAGYSVKGDDDTLEANAALTSLSLKSVDQSYDVVAWCAQKMHIVRLYVPPCTLPPLLISSETLGHVLNSSGSSATVSSSQNPIQHPALSFQSADVALCPSSLWTKLGLPSSPSTSLSLIATLDSTSSIRLSLVAPSLPPSLPHVSFPLTLTAALSAGAPTSLCLVKRFMNIEGAGVGGKRSVKTTCNNKDENNGATSYSFTSPFLMLASASCMRLYAISMITKAGQDGAKKLFNRDLSVSFSSQLLMKIVLPFRPDYVLPLSLPRSTPSSIIPNSLPPTLPHYPLPSVPTDPHVKCVVASAEGHLGFISQGECLVLQTPPPRLHLSPPPSLPHTQSTPHQPTQLHIAGNIAAFINKGKLSLYHSLSFAPLPLLLPSGIQTASFLTSVPSSSSGSSKSSSHHTSLPPSPLPAHSIVVGSTSGHVTIFDPSTFAQIVTLPPFTPPPSTSSSSSSSSSSTSTSQRKPFHGGGAAILKQAKVLNSAEKSRGVTGLAFACGGRILLTLYECGSVTATLFSASSSSSSSSSSSTCNISASVVKLVSSPNSQANAHSTTHAQLPFLIVAHNEDSLCAVVRANKGGKTGNPSEGGSASIEIFKLTISPTIQRGNNQLMQPPVHPMFHITNLLPATALIGAFFTPPTPTFSWDSTGTGHGQTFHPPPPPTDNPLSPLSPSLPPSTLSPSFHLLPFGLHLIAVSPNNLLITCICKRGAYLPSSLLSLVPKPLPPSHPQSPLEIFSGTFFIPTTHPVTGKLMGKPSVSKETGKEGEKVINTSTLRLFSRLSLGTNVSSSSSIAFSKQYMSVWMDGGRQGGSAWLVDLLGASSSILQESHHSPSQTSSLSPIYPLTDEEGARVCSFLFSSSSSSMSGGLEGGKEGGKENRGLISMAESSDESVCDGEESRSSITVFALKGTPNPKIFRYHIF